MHQTGTHAAVLAKMPFSSLHTVGHQPVVLHHIINRFRNVARAKDPAIVLEKTLPRTAATTSKHPSLMRLWSLALPRWTPMKTVVTNSAFNLLNKVTIRCE